MVMRGGGRLNTGHLSIRFLLTGASPRFGLTVSKKVGNAVTRNRVKRWLREAIRFTRGGLTGFDVVFIARPSAATAGASLLRDEVADALRRLETW